MPDLQQAARFLAEGKFDEPVYESPAGPISAIDICFGHRRSIARGNQFMAHKTGFSAETLSRMLTRCGFEGVHVETRQFDLWARAHKPKPTFVQDGPDQAPKALPGDQVHASTV